MGLLSLVGRPHDDDHDDRGGLHRDLRVNDWNDFSHYRVSGEGAGGNRRAIPWRQLEWSECLESDRHRAKRHSLELRRALGLRDRRCTQSRADARLGVELRPDGRLCGVSLALRRRRKLFALLERRDEEHDGGADRRGVAHQGHRRIYSESAIARPPYVVSFPSLTRYYRRARRCAGYLFSRARNSGIP